ncbi:MAG TPA: alpha/beta hydrolase [Thermomicrobiales bacterium]|nr:alpha/beta hydrolase [Thermomicrobiales bacterium]
MATFVLVHGATVGGWCWRWVERELRAAGHEVHTPTMTGLGERAHLATPEVDLDTHINDIVNVMTYEDLRDVVLVGWSYGGMAVAGVADRLPERVVHVVYLDSDIPRDGDTSVPPSRHAAREELARAFDGWRVPLGIDVDTTPPVAAWATWLELPREMRAWIAERIVPHPLKTWTQPIRLTGAAASIPTTYIRCTIGHDPTDEDTARQDDRIRSEPTWRYREIAESHLCPWTAPGAVVELLVESIAN